MHQLRHLVSSGKKTYGPKTINGSDPGKAPLIEATACNWAGFLAIKGFNGVKLGLGMGTIGKLDELGKRTRD
jgi:hypothetical protein